MFKEARGAAYGRVLTAIHANMLFDWYLEIGCRTGDTFAVSQSPTVAVDPYFLVEKNVIRAKPALHIFQTTSDAFFETGFLERNDIRLSFSFLDGLHLFEFLLRDFRNTERHSHPGGVIALHDCCPYSVGMTTRDLTSLKDGKPWTGDVWKLLPIFQKYRPDLKVTVLDAKTTGLVLVSNLDPGNTVLFDRYDEIVEEFSLSIDEYGLERFAESFDYVSASEYAAAGFADFAQVRRPVEGKLTPTKISP